MKTAIMTDTNSGINEEVAKELGIFVIHMPVIINDETFYENDTITEEEFFQALSSDKRISTSQPSPGDVMELWDNILENGYDELVYIPMSSGLSNSCESALGYSQEYDRKVQVVDAYEKFEPGKCFRTHYTSTFLTSIKDGISNFEYISAYKAHRFIIIRGLLKDINDSTNFVECDIEVPSDKIQYMWNID